MENQSKGNQEILETC